MGIEPLPSATPSRRKASPAKVVEPRRRAGEHGTSPRTVALEVLHATLDRGRPFDETMELQAEAAALEPRDRAFAYTLVATTLRRLGQIEALLDAMLRHPLPGRTLVVRNLLRLGICQLLFLATPAHAAVDTTVNLARKYRQGRHLGLINAVLRRLAGEGAAMIAAQDAALLNTPAWLWQSWMEAYGEEACRRIASVHLHEPPLDLTPRDDANALGERLDVLRLPTGTLRLRHRGPVSAVPGFAEGEWWVQDAAAALPVRLLGQLGGCTIIDLGAAPGGKTAQLAAAGARVTAVDRAPDRAARLLRNLERLRLSADVVVADALQWRPAEPADAVLLDVPCTATGTIRRHPDVGRVKQPDDVKVLQEVQGQLLRAAADMVRPGGLVVYCACSLQPEEGPDLVAGLSGCGVPLRREPLAPGDLADLPGAISADGDLRTLPFMLAESGGMDGFYAARLRRIGRS